MNTDFFFGGTSRPLMIHLDLNGPEDHIFFSLRFCDCTGLHFHSMGMYEDDVLTLRTPRELTRLSEWLGKLAQNPPVLSPGEWHLASWEDAGFSHISTEGIPRAHLVNFSVALWKLAQLWETKGINLNRAQPLGSTWGRARRVRKGGLA